MSDIRFDRLLALADRLEAQPERFRFGVWSGQGFTDHHCGTVGCSLGHATEMFGDECGVQFDLLGFPTTSGQDSDDDFLPSAVAIFGDLTDDECKRLFLTTLDGGILRHDCTAAEAAAEIRKFVAEKQAEVT